MAWQFAGKRALVYIGGDDPRGLDAEARKQFAAARAGRGEDEGRSRRAFDYAQSLLRMSGPYTKSRSS